MRTRSLHVLCGFVLCALFGACRTRDAFSAPYEDAQASFDAILAIDADGREPSQFVVLDRTRRYSRVMHWLRSPHLSFLPKFPAGRRDLVTVDVPAAELRDDLVDMLDQIGGDLSRLVGVAWRACYLLSNDDRHELDQFAAIAAIQQILEEIEVDVLAVGLPKISAYDRAGADFRPIATIQNYGADRSQRPLTRDQDAVFREAILLASRLPRSYPPHRRELLRVLDVARSAETDPELRALLYDATLEALAVNLVEELRRELLSQSFDVQQRAVRALRGLAEPKIVPWLLATGVGRIVVEDASGNPQPQRNIGTQRLMVHLCAQLQGDVLWATVGSGPSPAAYLYSVARQSPIESLRRFAVDGLCRSFGRPLQPDGEWIEDAFAEEYAAFQERRAAGGRP